MEHTLLMLLVIWNIVTFSIYALDKSKAINHQYRIPEQTLLLIALLGGGIGAFSAAHLIRHKIRRRKFQIILPITAIMTASLIFGLLLQYR